MGNFVLFVQLVGMSFTFVAVPGNDKKPRFDKSGAHGSSWKQYAEWKRSLDKTMQAKLSKFEEEFFKFSHKKHKCTLILVYELRAGQRLSIAAREYPHTSIVLQQEEGTEVRRALMIFHQLMKNDTMAPSEMDELREVAAAAATTTTAEKKQRSSKRQRRS